MFGIMVNILPLFTEIQKSNHFRIDSLSYLSNTQSQYLQEKTIQCNIIKLTSQNTSLYYADHFVLFGPHIIHTSENK